MEDKYFEMVRQINSLKELSPTLNSKELSSFRPILSEVDKSIISSFKGVTYNVTDKSDINSLANSLLRIVLERHITNQAGQYITKVCSILSLWNMKYGQDDNFENVI